MAAVSAGVYEGRPEGRSGGVMSPNCVDDVDGGDGAPPSLCTIADDSVPLA